MDSAEPLKKSEEEIKNSKDFSPLGELLQHWHKLLSPHATNALDQLYGLNVWQDQLDTQQTLINDAYLSHVSAKKDPVELWFGLCETILASAKDITQKSLAEAKWNAQDHKRNEFITNQIEFLFQPTNFFWSNRDAIETAIETKGRSIQKGFTFLSEDLSRGTLNLSPEKAFTIGENIAQTDGHVVFKNNLVELIQYEPKTKNVKTNPVLIVPPFINKFYILDLQESNSLVQHLVSQGLTVFMISWKNPKTEDGHLTWNEYAADGVLSTIDTIFDIYPKNKLNITGYCIGGTLAAMCTAILSDAKKEKISSLTLLNTLIDFSDVGEISNFISEEFVQHLNNTIGKNGIFPGSVMSMVFSALRPKELIWNYVESTYLKGAEPTPFDFLHWNADNTNVPGPLLFWYLKEMYLNNNLRRKGHLSVVGESVDLSTIACPCFVVASRRDHIVPWQTAYKSTGLLNDDCKFILASGGHVAGIIPSQNNTGKETHYAKTTDGKSRKNIQDWINESLPEKGSWWAYWTKWLTENSGGSTSRRKNVGNKRFKPIAQAPGEYVKH